jgi:hypothetical protein
MAKRDFELFDGGMSSTLYVKAPVPPGGYYDYAGLRIPAKAARYGLFYTSYDKKRHFAFYIPYRCPPNHTQVLCGRAGHLTATREQQNVCEVCQQKLQALLGGGP